MASIVGSENVSLDGVIQEPAGDEGFRVGGWVGLVKDRPQLSKLALDEALGAAALLLGRRPLEGLPRRKLSPWSSVRPVGSKTPTRLGSARTAGRR